MHGTESRGKRVMARAYRSELYRSIISGHALVPKAMGILSVIENIRTYIIASLDRRRGIVPLDEGSVLVSPI